MGGDYHLVNPRLRWEEITVLTMVALMGGHYLVNPWLCCWEGITWLTYIYTDGKFITQEMDA